MTISIDLLDAIFATLGLAQFTYAVYSVIRIDAIAAARVAWLRERFDPSPNDERLARASIDLYAFIHGVCGATNLLMVAMRVAA
jgi:hypothetical protein